VARFRIKSAAVKSDGVVLSSVLAELSRRHLPSSGWAALRSSVQASLETTCLATLAIGSDDSDEARLAQEFLVRVQNPNGSWPAFFGDDRDGVWVTSLAVIALRDVATAIPARLAGIQWLMKCQGKEANWFWRWKFLTTDRHSDSILISSAGRGFRARLPIVISVAQGDQGSEIGMRDAGMHCLSLSHHVDSAAGVPTRTRYAGAGMLRGSPVTDPCCCSVSIMAEISNAPGTPTSCKPPSV
jgi:hypothetical protein